MRVFGSGVTRDIERFERCLGKMMEMVPGNGVEVDMRPLFRKLVGR